MVDLAALDELVEGRPHVVQAGGRELGLVRWRDAVYAIRNVCPHMGARLCAGTVTAQLLSDGPRAPVAVDAGRPVISCPWHGWTYEIATGGSLVDPARFRVRSYPVAIVDGRVLVDLGRR
jgi:nitrite reductase/ring-hydroxylating ferredoxin subunit